ncbi:MAG: folylpolyglutamate synthase/dihydrofolate synthase family protein [Candidatus Dormibacteria bacterium]
MAPAAAPFDYAGALAYISSTGRFGIKMGLDRTRALLDEVGAPDQGMTGALVAGTNGKGSTCAFLSSILSHSGLRVAAMPKPHLVSYTERVVVDGVPITETDFAAAVGAMVPAVEAVTPAHGAPTEFEILTALALRHTRDEGADVLVCEVGMGGRLDATNITDLGVKVITSIALDHQRYLGDTIPEIAMEKAGIIRAGDLVVTGPLPTEAMAVVEARCAAAGAELAREGADFWALSTASGWEGGSFDFEATPDHWLRPLTSLSTTLLGLHQVHNAAVAVAAAQAVRRRHGLIVSDDAIRTGVAAATWPGRLEVFDGAPRVVVDGGHNPAAVDAVVDAVTTLGTDGPPLLLFGAMQDKDVVGMLSRLPRHWAAVFTNVADPRALPAHELWALAAGTGREGDDAEGDVEAALRLARGRAGAAGTVLVLGSLYLAGAVRALLTQGGQATVGGWD